MQSLVPIIAAAADGPSPLAKFATLLSLVSLLAVVLVVVWNFIQMKRVDRLQKRIEELEKK